MGGGTKTHAGANVAVRRTAVTNFCPEQSIGAVQLKLLSNSNLFPKRFGGVGGACICVANHDNVACHVYFHLKVPHKKRVPPQKIIR